MKRTDVILAILSLAILSVAVWAEAQTSGQPAQQNPAAAGQAAPAQGATPGAAAPAAKRPPQAKTTPEFDAYNAAKNNTDPAAMEKAVDDFATKFPDSELRLLLYKMATRLCQNANDAERTEAMGRKVLGFDENDPEALAIVA